MQINFLAVLVCGVLSMVLGFIWYGPILFGKKWMEVMGVNKMTEEQKKSMMKNSWKLYSLQFLLTLFELYVLSWYIQTLSDTSTGVHTAFSIWIAFLVPTIAGSAMWNGDTKRIAWNRFLIQVGYQFVLFIICGYILSVWI